MVRRRVNPGRVCAHHVLPHLLLLPPLITLLRVISSLFHRSTQDIEWDTARTTTRGPRARLYLPHAASRLGGWVGARTHSARLCDHDAVVERLPRESRHTSNTRGGHHSSPHAASRPTAAATTTATAGRGSTGPRRRFPACRQTLLLLILSPALVERTIILVLLV